MLVCYRVWQSPGRSAIKGLRKNNFTELAPGFRCSLKMGCENVKLFLRKPLTGAKGAESRQEGKHLKIERIEDLEA